ncbi:MAG: YigZ family protein, partial [Bacteroidales bacterium]|nr:YigZ family protein [Bacteroidales bacterium]
MAEVADTYKTIDSPAEGIYKEKGSKFLAKAYPVRTEVQVKAIVEQLKEEYYDARHHCYAYILGPKGDKWRANDDGEPSGTAGKPIHGQLLSFNLTNVLVVV